VPGAGPLTLACLSTTPALPLEKAKDSGHAKVLLLTRGQRNHHSDRDQVLYLANALEDTGRSEVTIGEDAS
jgi:uncharacterized protein